MTTRWLKFGYGSFRDELERTPSFNPSNSAHRNQQTISSNQIEQELNSTQSSLESVEITENPRSVVNLNPEIQSGYSLSWKNINYCVRSSRNPWAPKSKTLLANFNGIVNPREIMALMGPSGCGKTTLLDILANRVHARAYQGEVKVNGVKRESQKFMRYSSYVEVSDNFYEVFSVFETLMFTARMTKASNLVRHPKSRRERVQDVLEKVGLTDCQNTWVGGEVFRGISTGQRKRLSIAQELIREPWILLLDEPISGLDGTAAVEIVKILRSLAIEGKTIVLSLHQPVSRIWQLLDGVTLISQGHLLFSGPRTKIIEFLETSTGQLMQSANQNPGDFILDLVNNDFSGNPDYVDLIRTAFARSEFLIRILELQNRQNGINNQRVIDENRQSLANNNVFAQVVFSTHRALMNNVLHLGMYWIRIFTYLLLSLLIAGMFYDSDYIDPVNKAAMIFFVQSYLVIMTVAALPYMIKILPIFAKERRDGIVGTFAFVLSSFLAALPGILISSSVCAVIIFFLTNLSNFWWFLTVLFATLLCAESMMGLIASIANDFIVGLAFGAGIFGIFMINSGFLLPTPLIPNKWYTAWKAFHYGGFHWYSLGALMYNEFSSAEDLVIDESPVGSSHSEILVKYGMANVIVYQNVIILVGYAIALQILLAFSVFFKHTGKR